jgi:GAF domain-containing protein/CheY-like chemotaxis protein
VFLSRFQQDADGTLYFYVYAPVTPIDRPGTVTAVIQLRVSLALVETVLGQVLDLPTVRESGRRILVLDAANRILASSSRFGIDQALAYLGENPGAFELRDIGGGRGLSAASIAAYSGDSTPWRVVVADDLTSAMSSVNGQIILIAAIGGILLGLVLMFINLLLRPLIVEPLDEINRVARRMSGREVSLGDEFQVVMTALSDLNEDMETMRSEIDRQQRRRHRDLEVAARFSRETGAAGDTEALLTRTVDLLCESLDVPHASVFLLDETGSHALCVYEYGGGIGKNGIVVDQTTLGGRAIVLAQPQVPTTSSATTDVALPLIADGRVLGVLYLRGDRTDTFSVEDLPAYRLMAEQLAVALDNAHKLREAETRARPTVKPDDEGEQEGWGDDEQRALGYRYDLMDVRPVEDASQVPTNGRSLTVPIMVRGEAIGVIAAEPEADQTFTAGDALVMDAVAERVALAIENARLFRETQVALAETSTLYGLSRALNEASGLEGVIAAIVNTVVNDVSSAQIWVLEDEAELTDKPAWAEIAVDFVLSDRANSVMGFVQLTDYPFLQSFIQTAPTLVYDVRYDSRVDAVSRSLFDQMEARAVVAIPLTARGAARGFITLVFPTPRRFNERDGRTFAAVAEQASVAVDNRLLLRQTEDALTRQENLYAASRIINQAEGPADLIYAAVATNSNPDLDFALSVLEGDIDKTGWPTHSRRVVRSEGTNVVTDDYVFPLIVGEDSPMRQREPEVIVDVDPTNDKNLTPQVRFIRHHGVRFMAVFPLYSANQPIALFAITSNILYELTEEDQEVYRALTGQMSTQLQVRRLLERTELALDETQRLYLASSAISSAQDSEAVYQAATEHLAQPFLPAIARAEREVQISMLLAESGAGFDTEHLECVYAWSSSPDARTDQMIGRRLHSEEFPYTRLINETGDLLHFRNIAAESADPLLETVPGLRERLLDEGGASMIVAPVQSHMRWFGVVVCQADAPNAFNPSFERFVQAIADQVAVAVENRVLFEEAQSEAQRAQIEAQRALALVEAAQLANRIGEDFLQDLGDIFERVGRTAGFDRWMLLLYDDSRSRLEAVTLRAPGLQADDSVHYDMVIELPVVDAVRLNTTLLVNDLLAYPAMRDYTEAERQYFVGVFGKHVAVPVAAGGRVLGGVFMGRDAADAVEVDERDEQLVGTLAAQVAVALENQRLFQQARSEQRRLQSILATMPSGVLVLDPQTMRPVLANEQVETYLGGHVDTDKPFDAASYGLMRTGTHIPYPPDELPIVMALREGEPVFRDDIAVDHPTTGQIDLLVNAAPIHDDAGQVTAIVAAFQDISNLRSLENTLQENLRETVMLYDTQRQFSEAGALDEVLDVLMLQVAMIEPHEAYLLTGEDPVVVERFMMAPPEDANVLRSLLDPEHIRFVYNLADEDSDAARALAATGMASLVTVPVFTRQRPVAWLVLLNTEPEHFIEEQEPLLAQLGDLAASAIDNRILVERQEATLREIGALYNATTTISRTRDIEQLTVVLEAAVETMKPDFAAAWLELMGESGKETIELFFTAREGELPDLKSAFSGRAIPAEGMFIANLADRRDDVIARKLATLGIGSVAAVALRAQYEEQGGYLVLGYTAPRPFTSGESRYLSTVADSASVVVDNILLLEQVQSTLEETSVQYQASRALVDATTPDDLRQVVVDYLIPPEVDQVLIILLQTDRWDTPGASIRVASEWQIDGATMLEGLVLSHDQFQAWDRLASPEVFTVDDVSTDERLSDDERAGIESLGASSVSILPLRVTNRQIGAIWLGSRDPRQHTTREQRIYLTFAEQASLLLETAYLFQQTERRARQLETSARVSQTAGTILDLEVLLPQVVDLIRDSFGYDHVQIFLMDEDDDYAVLRASTGEAGRQLLEIQHRLQKGSTSVIGQVTETGVPQIALDTADATVIHKPNPYLPLTRSEMALPIVVQGKVAGALDVQSNQPAAFNEEDVRVLTTLAAQISVAIDNARLYEDVQATADRMGFLFEITNAAAATGDSLEERLQTVASRIQDSLDAASVVMYLPQHYVDHREQRYSTVRAVALAGSGQPLSEIEETRLDDEASFVYAVTSSMRPVVINDVARERGYVPVVPRARSAILVPLVSGMEFVGMIAVEKDRPNAFDNDTRQVLLTLAGSLSAIIQSAQLLEQLTKTNEQLRELDKLKSDFLANMSHELRTPLNSIIGFSRVMLKGIDGALTEMQEQDLSTIYNSGQHLLMLINDLLDQAKIAAGKMDIKYEHFDVKAVVEAVKSIGIGLVKDKPIDLTVEFAHGLPQAYGDEFRVRQVLINLVSNAAKFTQQGGITLTVYPFVNDITGQSVVRIDVSDTGIGIEGKDLPLLFEAFRQVDSSLTRTVGGTGLGLPIAKSLMEMQGGELTVMSEVNVGSTFSISIPTEPTAGAESGEDSGDGETGGDAAESAVGADANSHGSGEPVDGEPKTHPTLKMKSITSQNRQVVLPAKREVLLIEDNKDMVDQFRRILQRDGFDVQTADHPMYTEAMASTLRPTIIVMDVNFAEGEGWNLLERLKERDDTFDIPIIVVTLDEDTERAYRLGAHTVIQRPFMPEDLSAAAAAAELESNTERILIIDDQPEAVRLLTELLNEQGSYRVFAASSGREGIAMVARRRPDLIILDLRMPEMDGFAVLEELRANPETASIPVMAVTGDITLSDDEQARLETIRVLYKTDISQEDYERFIRDVQDELGMNGS